MSAANIALLGIYRLDQLPQELFDLGLRCLSMSFWKKNDGHKWVSKYSTRPTCSYCFLLMLVEALMWIYWVIHYFELSDVTAFAHCLSSLLPMFAVDEVFITMCVAEYLYW